MDKGRIIRLVLIPIVAGLIVTLIAQRLLAPSQPVTAAAKVETVPMVVVASKEPIPARTRIAEAQLTVKQVPKELAGGSEFSSIKDVAGKISLVTLPPGEVVRKERVVEQGKGALPYRIPEGMRAVTIRMDELSGVAGYPEPGDLVDLILFLSEKKSDGGGLRPASTRIMYEGVAVLAKGLAPVGDAPAARAGEQKLTSVTLALTPAAAVDVALAEQIGYIKLLLRPALKQNDAGPNTTYESKYMLGAPAPAQAGR